MKKIKFNEVKIEKNPDSRNYTIARFIPGVDEITDEDFMLPLPELNVIINQANYGACVGHSFATVKSILEYIRTNKWIDFDPFLIYGTRYPDEYDGEGMYSWQGVKNLHKEGAYFRRDFNKRLEMPQLGDVVKQWKKDNPDKVASAKDYVITGYSYVTNVDQFKKSLKNQMPISVTYPIYSSFYDVKDDGIVPNVNKNEKVEGYHQMTVVGWTKNNYWIVINSWGTKYGLKGMYFIPFDYPFDNAIAVSDTITPSKYKAKRIELSIGKKEYKVDNIIKEFDSVPILRGDRTYVPVRFISEALGASVEWIGDDKKVIIRSEEAVIEMTIGKTLMVINNKKVYSDVEPIIRDDRTLLPVRIIAEHLNCKVGWNGVSGTVTIKAL